MRIEVIFCPSCNHKLRVPEELMSRPVQCPQCQATFLAPPPREAVAERPLEPPLERQTGAITRQTPPEPEPQEPRRPPTFDAYDLNEPERMATESNEGKVLAPAFVLLAIAGLGLVLDVIEIVIAVTMPNVVKQAYAAYGIKPPAGMNLVTTYIVTYLGFLVLSLFSVFGAACMMKRKLFPIAVLGAIAAMLNITHCCCIPGTIVGIWALIVLFQPDVRASFH